MFNKQYSIKQNVIFASPLRVIPAKAGISFASPLSFARRGAGGEAALAMTGKRFGHNLKFII
jgi:hypothetical protein